MGAAALLLRPGLLGVTPFHCRLRSNKMPPKGPENVSSIAVVLDVGQNCDSNVCFWPEADADQKGVAESRSMVVRPLVSAILLTCDVAGCLAGPRPATV